MTDRPRDHAPFDELVAGYALDALDPADQRLFLRHLPGCHRCQRALADYLEITAALAGTEQDGPGEPGPQLRDRILAATAAGQERDRAPDAAPGAAPLAPRPGPSRRHGLTRRRAILASAAAAVLIAGGAVAGGLAAHGSGASPPLASSCTAAAQCRDLMLTSARTGKAAARLVIKDGTVWLVPSGLPANNTARQIYVLWQITGGHTPLAVGSFDVSGDHGRPVLVGTLAVPYKGTWAFAVSRENGRLIPARPSHPVALGQVS